MSVFPKGAQLLDANYGISVTEPAKTIPATTFSNIFTVSGGRILLTSLVGQVTTAIGALATTLSIGFTPTGGSLVAASIATATAITSSPVGTLVSVAFPVAGLVVGVNPGVVALGGASIDDQTGLLVSAGVISISTSASTTGAMSWTMTYLPYDAAAGVAAV
jgi:hypothetical protein